MNKNYPIRDKSKFFVSLGISINVEHHDEALERIFAFAKRKTLEEMILLNFSMEYIPDEAIKTMSKYIQDVTHGPEFTLKILEFKNEIIELLKDLISVELFSEKEFEEIQKFFVIFAIVNNCYYLSNNHTQYKIFQNLLLRMKSKFPFYFKKGKWDFVELVESKRNQDLRNKMIAAINQKMMSFQAREFFLNEIVLMNANIDKELIINLVELCVQRQLRQ